MANSGMVDCRYEVPMKFYERLNPVERKKLVLGAAAFDAAMEGMSVAKADCVEALRAIEREQMAATTVRSGDQTAP